ncbi:hypothetical protein [Bacillus thuringiensis]|uniref:hypothetical protein n=1 Tax=Bacillus thuringiensis TaxID=1428 RepID=UPI0005AF010F|nr:hypothetical protein [Bacillus thuringiensis]KIP28509.1 hypothetical protein BG10_6727 [Bacillus thuringiensis serovar morrisoni]MCT6948294.1 hypothetical protein [Bacillus thuringiensis]MED2080183.1 hypothetical protein [Bacillus thuringiensis]MEE2015549.1 hypothetical protein [Bacillus thuringiensis]NUW49283.1 hypothetical protein [Bacillus thuringiensis]
MSNLLNEHPLIVLPSLAVEIGLNEAIIVQQIHYWLQKSNHEYDGRKWIYNSAEEWKKQFPFWGIATIRRTFTKLENSGLLLVGNYNKLKIDRTKWYSIDYKRLSNPSNQNDQMATNQNDQMTINQNEQLDMLNMIKPLPETTQRITETTSKAKAEEVKPKRNKKTYSPEFEELWSVYPKKRNKPKAYQRYNEARAKFHSHEVILYGVQKYTEECNLKQTPMNFIKMLEGFLNDERYLEYKRMDEVKQKAAEAKQGTEITLW